MKTTAVAQSIRQSNMELLRIVAMFMILGYHTVYYVFYNYRGESPIFASLMTLLHIGVPLFILISGYFGIKPSIKGFLKLYLILLFYNLLFYGIRIVYGDVSFSVGEFLKLWFPFSIGSRWWFFKVYMMLYLFTPVVNFLRDRMGGGKLLIISGFVTFYWGWFAQHPSLFDGKNVVNFIFLYMLGHWLRTKIVEKTESISRARSRYIMEYLVLAVCLGLALFFSGETMQDHLKRLCYGYNSPVLILMSVLFFLIFTTFDFKSKPVNWVAGSVFAVYCIHEAQYFFRAQWYNFFEQQYLSNNGLFPLVLVGNCLLLYTLCILFDKVRDMITRPLINPLESLIQKVVNLSSRMRQVLNDKFLKFVQ